MITLSTFLAGACIACLLVGDRIEHLGLKVPWALGERAQRVSDLMRVACVLLGWLTILSLVWRAI